MVQADSGLVVSAVIRPVHPQQASLGWWRQELLRNGREKTKKNVIQIHFSRLSLSLSIEPTGATNTDESFCEIGGGSAQVSHH